MLTFVISKEWIGVLGFFPLYTGIRSFFTHKSKEKQIKEKQIIENQNRINKTNISSNIFLVASLNFASGVDNIVTYMPLLANASWEEIFIIILVFLGLTYIWCWIP